MKIFSSFGSINYISRFDFFRDLILIIVVLVITGGVINSIAPGADSIISVFLGLFTLKFIYILIIKRFHDFNRLGRNWARAYIGYIILLQILFALIFPISEWLQEFLIRNENIFFVTMNGLSLFPLIIIGLIPGVNKDMITSSISKSA